ncbi:LD-carboxypeptidase [Leptolyngbya sp. FACHB-17]|uniref:S66 peptidase family protein n=1 Tax=unclassified Leptolyngbya TaxID=2650499 RepID=UPI001681470A|nr:LD-carboxypeptidase [Leptolyngbya sp. FACHB-17]MBD2082847.1 LD-carboxypeptidase [Leptolyngbya sp. FACHB-17]
MKRCQPPAPLKPGDRLCVIAPSGTLRELTAFKQGIEVWRQRGYQVELMAGFDDQHGYLAGTDEQRRAQFAAALNDPACRGILCARGGWGGARVLEKWRFPAVEPKWLIGFSDITSLLWAYAEQGVSGVHAPLLTTIAAEPEWSKKRLFDWIEGRSLPALQGSGWVRGQASGLLLPANLTVATHLLGTPWQPDFSGVILAIEDVTEAPYRIDRMLTQWRLCGEFRHIRGIAIGRFSKCDPPAGMPSFSIEEVLRDRLSDLGIPIVSGLPFGHDGENAALPVGIPTEIDGDRGILSFQANT